MDPLRIGVLGAARIAPLAVISPAREAGHRVVAVAARDGERARRFAAEHGIDRVASSYDDLVADPDVEVIYNPLPNGLHAPWTLAAVDAGKHVLVEKPFASNAGEAERVRGAVAGSGVVVMEAFHYRFHPVMLRVLEIVADGDIGDIGEVEARFRIPAPPEGDLRWSHPLAGGGIMDVGCYALHALRILAPWTGGEPAIVSGRGVEHPDHAGIDQWAQASIEFPSGATAIAECSMDTDPMTQVFRLRGSRGEVSVASFVRPDLDDTLTVTVNGRSRVEALGRRTSYAYQLDAFALAVREGGPVLVDLDDSVATMRLIDRWYDAIGLGPRPTT